MIDSFTSAPPLPPTLNFLPNLCQIVQPILHQIFCPIIRTFCTQFSTQFCVQFTPNFPLNFLPIFCPNSAQFSAQFCAQFKPCLSHYTFMKLTIDMITIRLLQFSPFCHSRSTFHEKRTLAMIRMQWLVSIQTKTSVCYCFCHFAICNQHLLWNGL